TEVLVALPDQRAVSGAGLAISQELTGLGHRAGTWPIDQPPGPAARPAPGDDRTPEQDGPAEVPGDYPVADFLSPTGYAWDEDVYAAEEAVKAYLKDSHAD